MLIFLQIIFWISVLALFHSYVLYPLILKILVRGKKNNQIHYSHQEKLPHLFLLMSVYNEESVIDEKLKSVFNTTYPLDKLAVLVGSDGSTDQTDQIIEKHRQKYPQIKFTRFGGRNGKSNILNQLFEMHREYIFDQHQPIFIMTDANVMFSENMLYELAKHFKNPDIGIVGANIVNRGMKEAGISFQEKSYIQRENKIKYYEGVLWGNMMGAFGACYALKAEYFSPIPPNYLMEDFYITMSVLDRNKDAIKEMDAIAFEDLPDSMQEEFRRKKRISSGNFQNLSAFKHLLNPKRASLAFSFLSHKILRWLGPFFILMAFISCLILSLQNDLYRGLLILQVLVLSIPMLDWLLKQLNIHIKLFRFITYFYYMNYALLIGFINYLKGIKTNAWQPPKRKQ